ncbi:subtilisin-like protein [Anaeromyces robustus]|uniref:Subtilisin-like protein n=1 Tax=Anaeromyces robustus TaxID=1754192 RepID=A0A1Y1X3J2_9FUNG|nr:subtilisin-like protein [Anaeromyces robustus]|eukprot:ORX80377.1 subtilisin-like protein [Anaeromyces robustus]
MNNYFFIYLTLALLANITGIYAENAEYIIAIRRKENDENYIHASPEVQKKIDELVNDKMNDIYEIIEDKRDTYFLDNGEMDNNLNELENVNQLRKRSNKITKFYFINTSSLKRINDYKKRSLDITNSNSTIEYIPFESNIINHVCPVSNYYTVNAYLSDEVAEIVCNLDNVIHCEKSVPLDLPTPVKVQNLNETEIEIINKNKNDMNEEEYETDNSLPIYYDIEKIKNETKWSDVSVQYDEYYINHLSSISQGPIFLNNKSKDNYFYYPSSAGQGIDIYLMDMGLIVDHEDFDETERTITCDAIINDKIIRYTTENEKKNCNLNDNVYPDHGIMVTSIAGGNIFGVAKKANLHMIASTYSLDSSLRFFNYIIEHATPYKTVISISRGGLADYSDILNEKINELINEGFILIVAAGNDDIDCCAPKDSEEFFNFTGYPQTIVVGATSYEFDYGYNKALYSNHGKCVDIFAPGNVIFPNLSEGSRTDYDSMSGTSCAAPIVAGVAASIMAEHPDIKFDNEKMRQTLIEMSLKDIIYDIKNNDSPNRFLNNGKRSVYSLYDIQEECGPKAGNRTCEFGCCSKDGKCLKYYNYPWDECYVENGCQSEFGDCATLESSRQECKYLLNYKSECLNEITSDMTEEEIETNCSFLLSQECKEFTRNVINGQSICSSVNQYETIPSIENYNKEKFLKNTEICDNNFLKNKEECDKEIMYYYECFVIEDSDVNDINIFRYHADKCKKMKSDKCSVLYQHGKEDYINYLPHCYTLMKYYNYNSMDMMMSLDSYYDKIDNFFKFCETYSEVAEQKCKEVYEENSECYTESNCEIINSSKCKEFKNNIFDNPTHVCKTASISYYEYINVELYYKNIEKCTEDYMDYDHICNYQIQSNYDCLIKENFEKNSLQEMAKYCNNFKYYNCSEIYTQENGLINTLSSCYLYYKQSGYNTLIDYGLNISFDDQKNKETYKKFISECSKNSEQLSN